MNPLFTDHLWTKNWSGNWGLLFGSYYGKIYTSGLNDLVGQGFQHNLITFESGTSANYLIVEELKAYCAHLVNLISNKESLPQKWSEQVIHNTDKIFTLMRELNSRSTFSQLDFNQLQENRLIITTANFSIKKIIDYLPPNLTEKYLDLFTKVRIYTEPVYNETDRLLKKIILSISEGKIPEKLISVLTTEEVGQYFLNKKLPSLGDLEGRINGCALLYDEHGEMNLFQGQEYKNLISTITAHLANREITGMVAYKGKATGKVRVVLDPKNCLDFEEGDILVAGMTRPEYLNLMKKSSAFVTDAGGLLSHAAIVARELKKPCIVGTEIATKVLKDGDKVEVDAESGIVKKIS